MRSRAFTLVLLGAAALAGCGGGGDVVTPADLQPLTEAQKEEIRQEDLRIDAEERGPDNKNVPVKARRKG